MSSLSSGTLNLKFMQRAAARQALQSGSTSTPSTPQSQSQSQAGPSRLTPSSSFTPSRPGTNSTPQSLRPGSRLTEEDQSFSRTPESSHAAASLALQAEEDAKWYMPRRSTEVKQHPNGSHEDDDSSSERFQSGYMSFLQPNEESDEDIDATPGGAGGGRFSYGGFGKEASPELDSEDEETLDHSQRVPEGAGSSRKRPRESDAAGNVPASNSRRSFMRPEGFDTPSSSRSAHRYERTRDTDAQPETPSHKPSKSSHLRNEIKESPGQSAVRAASDRPNSKSSRAPQTGLRVSRADKLRATISAAKSQNTDKPLSSSTSDSSHTIPSTTTLSSSSHNTLPNKIVSPRPEEPVSTVDVKVNGDAGPSKKKKRRNNPSIDATKSQTQSALSVSSGSRDSSPVKAPSKNTPQSPQIKHGKAAVNGGRNKGISSIDQREAELKAQRKKEKKARRKAAKAEKRKQEDEDVE